jgi:hypothetical protein
MSRYVPDLSTLGGILEDVAPRLDDKLQREQVKNLVEDLDYEFGERMPVTFGGDNPGGEHQSPAVTVSRTEHVRQRVAGMQYDRAEVPVIYGEPGKVIRDRVTVDRIGTGVWVTGGAEAIRALFVSRNPKMQIGISPGPVDITTRVLNNRTGEWE